MDFRGMSVADIDELMAEAKEARRVAVAREEAVADNAIREKFANIKEGDTIKVIFKGEEREVSFVGLTEKRFTVLVDGNKRSIMFNKYVG